MRDRSDEIRETREVRCGSDLYVAVAIQCDIRDFRRDAKRSDLWIFYSIQMYAKSDRFSA
jgi:hypothetical protein